MHLEKYYGVGIQGNDLHGLTDSDIDEIQNILDQSSDEDEDFMGSPFVQFPKPKKYTKN